MLRLNSLLRPRPAQTAAASLLRPLPRPYARMGAPSAAESDAQAETVANTSGVTTASLQKTIAEKLEAKHVDIEDMSGKGNGCPEKGKLVGCLVLTTFVRRVRPDVSSHDRFTPLREEEQSRATSARQFGAED